jgi:hypothetical protein
MAARSPVEPSQPSGPLTPRVIAALRRQPTSGLSRRTLLRRSLGLAVGVAALEGLAGMLSFVWPTTARSG